MPGRQTPAPVKTENAQYYDILGVSEDACEKELKKAWRLAIMKFHPDKGGDKEKFNEVCEAYSVLSNLHKHGEYHQPLAIGYKISQRLKLGGDVKHPLRVSHEELQTGTVKLVRLSRNIICLKCKGKGSKSGASVTVSCTGCQGTGKVLWRVQHLGRKWRISYSCKECRGTGKTINIIDRCSQCKGDKVVQERKVLEIHVEEGMKYGQKIIFPEVANEEPDFITGDVVFKLCDMPLEFEDDSEEDSEEMLSVSEGDSEEMLSVSEEDGEESSSNMESFLQQMFDIEFFLRQMFKGDCEEDSNIELVLQQDCEEDSDIECFLRKMFKEDCEEDSNVELVLQQDCEEDSDEIKFSLSQLSDEE